MCIRDRHCPAHMHVGIFIEEARPGSTPAEAFQDKFDLIDAAEAWGLGGVWLGEIHFNVARSVLSSPLQRPHPPIRMAVNTPESSVIPGQLGIGVFVGVRALDIFD